MARRGWQRNTAIFLTVLVVFLVGACAPSVPPAGLASPPTIAGPASAAPARGPLRPSDAAIHEAYGRLPLHFEANRGQADARVRFLARARGHGVLFTPDEVVLGRRDAAVRMSLVGARPNPTIRGLDELPGKVNYLAGRDARSWQRDVPTYARVQYEKVYPGIDLVFHGNQRQLEYDFVVAPGADPARIRLRFRGGDRLELDAAGNLVISIGAGKVLHRKPLIYQDRNGRREPIPGEYVLRGRDQVTFRVAPYDKSRALVIDPVVEWSTYLGGNDSSPLGDEIRGLAVDGAGNVYVAGSTRSDDFPWTSGIAPPPGEPGSAPFNGFVAKLNPSGSALLFASYVQPAPRAIALDGAGNIYLGGATSVGGTGPTLVTTPGSVQPTPSDSSGFEGYVLKLNPSGTAVLYTTYLGGPGGGDGVNEIGVDAEGNIIVAGLTSSPAFPTTSGAAQTAYGGGTADGFVAKLNASGDALVYGTYVGGTAAETLSGLAVDAGGNAYVVGGTGPAGFPVTPGALKTTLAPSDPGEGFVTKLGPTGALVYSTFLGGSAFDEVRAVDVDAAGNAYVTGRTTSTDFPLAAPYHASPSNTFVSKLNAAGSALVYSTYFEEANFGLAIGVDAAGAAYVAGWTGSETFPTVNGIPGLVADPVTQHIWVAKFNASGQITSSEYSTLVPMNWDGRPPLRLVPDNVGNVYLAGTTDCGFAGTPGAFQPNCKPDIDGFIMKLGPGTSGGGDAPPASVIITSPSNNAWTGNSIKVSATATDDVGLTKIEFWGNGAIFGTVACSGTSCSGTVTWITGSLPPAAYEVQAVATDTLGQTTVSAPVKINKDATSPTVKSGAPSAGGGGGGDTTAPTVAITGPANGATVSGTVTVSANASDNVGVASVQFKVDGANLGAADTTAPYSTNWDTKTATNGTHTLTAVATDAAGNTTTSAPVTVTVNNPPPSGGDPTPPTVAITFPSNGAWMSNGVKVSVTASDNVSLATVKLWGAGAVFAETCGGTPSCSFTAWFDTTGKPNGQYELNAVATDTAGNQTISATVKVNKNATSPVYPSGAMGGSDTTPPTVAMTAPANGSTVSGTVTVSASASDNVGVVSVQFKLDGGDLGAADTTAPYAVPWNTTSAPNGSHTLTAVAKDAAGNTTTSAPVTVTVSNPPPSGGDTTPPAVAITSPSNGAWTGNSIKVVASGSDNVGLATLKFYGNGVQFAQTSCGGATTCSGTHWWLTGSLPPGKHTITVVAADTAGHQTTSAPVVINK